MKNQLKQEQYKVYERNGQLFFSFNTEKKIPANAPVRLTSAQLEELDYRKLYRAYSPKGRKSKVDPRVMFKVMVYGYQCGIYSSRKLEEACRYRIDFMWLLEDQPAPDHATFARFRTGRCAEAAEELFYQYVKLLEEQEETDHETVFIDGTKMESRAGRYTFRWRKTVEKQLTRVKQKVLAATGLKTLEALAQHVQESKAGIAFVHGKGQRKSREQREWEAADEWYRRWEGYERDLEIMGNSRNSYSTTDHDATFMRMKEDHMRNGQLKPGYNVQIAVNSEYITGVDVFYNRTDSGTLIPFLKQIGKKHGSRYHEVVADAGYESLNNLLFLESSGQLCFVKPSNYDAQKTKKFRSQIGRIENMRYDPQEDAFFCAQGRKLPCRREQTEMASGQPVTTAWYRCETCQDCPQRSLCCRAKDDDAPKEIKWNRTFWEKRAAAQHNICTPRGITLRMCRSIQVEGAFALLKTDFAFRRFLTRGKANVRTEMFFLCLAFNLKKLWMKREHMRLKTHLSEICIA